MEYWTMDSVTKQCSRLDYARVCVMLDYNSTLPKHVVIISPFLRGGREVPVRVDIEYEWLPQRCKDCQSLGHTAAYCPETKKPVNDPSMISAAAWNVRGLNGIAHQKSVGQLVGEFQVQFLGLLETRVRAPNAQIIQKSTLPTWRWFVDYNDPGSRIWLAWCEEEVEVNILAVDKQFIHCDMTNKKEHTKCLITVLYGDNELTGRRELWHGILQLSRTITDEPWLVMGDFNAVIDDSEVSGYAADTRVSMAEFLECITESELNHLPFTGAHFTWHNCSDGGRSLWKRLDRMLVNEAWLVKWPQSKYVSANPRTSDHSPLILQGQDRRMDNYIFRFENYMTKMQGFQRLIEDHWSHNVRGTAMYKLTGKLKYMKPLLRALKKTHGNLSYNVEQAAFFLQQAQQLIQEFKHNSILLQLETCCRMIYCKAVSMEVIMLKQRAKLAWLKGGDHSSKIFFRKINARRASQRIYQVQNDTGTLLTDFAAVKDEFVTYYKQLFGETRRQSQLNLDHLQPYAKHLISEDEAEQLIAPIQRHEIKDALFDINEDSAPGPDGFSSCFFKATWTVVGEDVCQAVMEFFNHGRLLKQLNATLITLIPKVQMPIKVGDFRPISCCNVVYKIITKVMVTRMHLVLEKLIDSCQNAFVPGRSISDNILLAQELLSGYNQKKLPPRCTVKVDLQKAYDMVEWDYLLAVLRLFKFPNKFIMWIEQCITTASFSISLNGSIHGFFSSSRGLRQGDPISPYLFVLVMESLHLLIKSKVTRDTAFQYHWRCKELGIVNLCFADDLLLFCKADLHSVTVLHSILQEFKDLSGLQANAQKSQVLLSKLQIK
ncbi:UNVERIFIED_CONTAM: hypothetical protein Scaly_3046100 [Sesamum calycinum]|uniref:Reverse transcriptase domain-containing protein n=1 Tax=Sesamum calycinum TaxID=2727403 RepID=A0AAW2K0P6_9LAMI